MTDQNAQIKALQEQIDLLMKAVPQEDLKRLKFKNKPTGTDIFVNFYRDDETMTKKVVTGWKMLLNDPYIDPATKRPIDNQKIRVFFQQDITTESKVERYKKVINDNTQAINELSENKKELFDGPELKLLKNNWEIAEDDLRLANDKLKTAKGEEKKKLEKMREEISDDSREKYELYDKKLKEIQVEAQKIEKTIEAKLVESKEFTKKLQEATNGSYVDLDYKVFGTRAIEKQLFSIKSKKEINGETYYVVEYEGQDLEINAKFIN